METLSPLKNLTILQARCEPVKCRDSDLNLYDVLALDHCNTVCHYKLFHSIQGLGQE